VKATITAEFLKTLPAPPCEVWDTKLPGLVLRVRESGRASWVFVYGRGRKVTLGRADAIGPAKARELAGRVIGDVADGKDPQLERRKRQTSTLRAFLDEKYAPWVASQHRRPDVITRITTVFPEAMLRRPMHEITAFALEQWRIQRRRAGVTDSTINRDLDALRGAFSRAVDWRLLDEHPMRDVRRAKVDSRGRVRYLSPEEETRLRDALIARDVSRRDGRRRFNQWRADRGYKTLPDYTGYPDHLHPMVRLALNTGLRRGELFHLRWADVDLGASRLTVRGATAKSHLTRHVPLNRDAVETLRTWRSRRGADDDVYVFPGPQGEPMTTLKTAWLRLAKAARLKHFTFHDLRHTFASKLVMAGVDLNTVRELLGHADIKMTLRYAHLAPEHKQAAVDTLVAGRS